ncbi:angiogenic factor with G patch and FHA domains 1 isoform X3 [Anastrepha ludens]|uniref:angiogenic factor with G patch and FHA domains 1 isoform X3 n=1 Tax=Anastrepha ludens TaxID=28586 RepID=UPI0023AECA08|nr:angiogenic factor with G patch and FHA domains 1 isoform X3 [Anastrepha ludens]
MSDSESENNTKDVKRNGINFQLKENTVIVKLEHEELCAYIGELHELLIKKDKKIKKYREKYKELLKKFRAEKTKENSDTEKTVATTSVELATTTPALEDNKLTEDNAATVDNFVDEIRQAAEQAQNLNGFVYEPTSGLYYDQKTGYYYNAEYGLYYDGNNGCYYNYNQERNAFEFHSQVSAQQLQKTAEGNNANCKDVLTNYVNNSLLNRFSNLNINRMRSNALDIAKKYPPSLRIIVQESNLDSLKVGSLSLITYKGGSLGREGNHDVIIPDVNVSKLHMKFHYDHKQCIYKCIDLGSRNGTVLNGTRMSASKKESSECDLAHGSVLQIGQTKLLCHVHEGNSTCGLCEPGLLIEPPRESTGTTSNTVVLSHREQLKKLQKKYGLEKEKFVEAKQIVGNYNDRAATRRIQIGSSTDGEKTQSASVNTEISSENKGFKMLSKLGWNKGEALGKANDGSGLLEPINVASNEGKKGLGCEAAASGSVALSNADKRKIATWKKTQARYQQTDIFGDSEDST